MKVVASGSNLDHASLKASIISLLNEVFSLTVVSSNPCKIIAMNKLRKINETKRVKVKKKAIVTGLLPQPTGSTS